MENLWRQTLDSKREEGGGTKRTACAADGRQHGHCTLDIYFFFAPGEKNDMMLAEPFASAALGPFFGVSFIFLADLSS